MPIHIEGRMAKIVSSAFPQNVLTTKFFIVLLAKWNIASTCAYHLLTNCKTTLKTWKNASCRQLFSTSRNVIDNRQDVGQFGPPYAVKQLTTGCFVSSEFDVLISCNTDKLQKLNNRSLWSRNPIKLKIARTTVSVSATGDINFSFAEALRKSQLLRSTVLTH